MLETILEKSKNLIKKAKKPFITTLAGLTLLWAVGCNTMTTRVISKKRVIVNIAKYSTNTTNPKKIILLN